MAELLVKSIRDAARHIRTFELVDPAGVDMPAFKAGAHVEVQLPSGDTRQYSLCNDPANSRLYRLAVLREIDGRGGSASFHDDINVGDVLKVSPPQNNFPLDQRGRHYTMIAGGIGITPMLAMAYKLKALRKPIDFHVCVHSNESVLFRRELEEVLEPDEICFHISDGDPSRRLDLDALLQEPIPGGLVYCCGPQELMDGVAAATSRWYHKNIRFEIFTPGTLDGSDSAFNVTIASTGQTICVESTQTILQALRANGIKHPFSCEVGLCRSCTTRYCDGDVEHRDQDVLTGEERKTTMTVCVSRCSSAGLTLEI